MQRPEKIKVKKCNLSNIDAVKENVRAIAHFDSVGRDERKFTRFIRDNVTANMFNRRYDYLQFIAWMDELAEKQYHSAVKRNR